MGNRFRIAGRIVGPAPVGVFDRPFISAQSEPDGKVPAPQSLVTTTPIDNERVRVVARHRVAPLPTRWLTSFAAARFAAAFAETLEEDIAIWEHKVYRARPMATKRDWAILEFRKWARQFYPDGVYEAALKHEADLREAGTLP